MLLAAAVSLLSPVFSAAAAVAAADAADDAAMPLPATMLMLRHISICHFRPPRASRAYASAAAFRRYTTGNTAIRHRTRLRQLR